MVYIIVFQARSLYYDYTDLYNKIKSIGDDYIQAMDCLWFIHSDKPLKVEDVAKELRRNIGSGDFLFVSELPNGCSKDGYLRADAWYFIKSKERRL